MFAIVHAFAYGRRGGRHAVVLSTHATAAEAFRALDAMAASVPPDVDPGTVADCYVVDAQRNPVSRREVGEGPVSDPGSGVDG